MFFLVNEVPLYVSGRWYFVLVKTLFESFHFYKRYKLFMSVHPKRTRPAATDFSEFVQGYLVHKKGSMVFLQNNFRCPPMLGARSTCRT